MAATLTLLASGVLKQSSAPSAMDDVVFEVQYYSDSDTTDASPDFYGVGNTNASAGVDSASKITNFLMALMSPGTNTDSDIYTTIATDDGQARSKLTTTLSQYDDLTMLFVGKAVTA